MIIYPLKSLHPKQELIFRYPGHRKKLIQYCQSKIQRLKNQKLKKADMHPLIKEFIGSYISHKKNENVEVLLFKKKLIQNPNEFYKTIENFVDVLPNPYNYPQESI